MSELAIIAVHGMGDTKRNFDQRLKKEIRDRVGDDRWQNLVWRQVYFQDILQENQERVMQDSMRQANVDWIRLRRFLLYGFSDAATMQARPHLPGSVYQQIQQRILNVLEDALKVLGDPKKPVVVISHSLGCQVVSNFIWDAQSTKKVESGVFRSDSAKPIGKTSLDDKFRRLKTLRYWFTSGCNIPIFVAGLPKKEIHPVETNSRGWRFRWENYYDPDDVLGWPLQPLSSEYRTAVAVDRDINAGGLVSSWTPMSHLGYWKDDDFLDPIENALRSLL